MCAASPRIPVEDSQSSGTNRPSINLRLALPPAPWAISICGSWKRILEVTAVAISILPLGRGADVGEHGRLAMLVIKVGRAGAFGRDHQRADRMLRRAFIAEKFALRRLQHSLQHFAALRGFRIGNAQARHVEALLGV